MEVLGYGRAKERFAALSLRADPFARTHTAPFAGPYGVPQDSGRKTVLARALVRDVMGRQDTFLLLDETAAWPSCGNESLLLRYRGTPVPDGGVAAEPAHFAGTDEADIVEGLVALSLYFVWGFALVGVSTGTLVRVSHDEWLTVESHNAEDLNAARSIVEALGLRVLGE